MKKLIGVMFVLLLAGLVVTFTSCGGDDDEVSNSEAPEGTRELTQNGITAKIAKEQWGFNGTVLYVTVELTKHNSGVTPTGKVYLQARTTEGQVLNDYGNGTFGGYWLGNTHYVQTTIHLPTNKTLNNKSLTILKIQVN